ncbi:Aspartic proteinase-like protein 2 [Camellia lanceoleosa]|uniref:Aspartic proteinase-like protein 2 n=1 Tax=Camellia lanceoleosa TaxID=1840588 RepID=A0ACC0FUK0_9ERIC|nr:Aspartic proteinase-like protein 2 [Camellia lanceoleosa]
MKIRKPSSSQALKLATENAAVTDSVLCGAKQSGQLGSSSQALDGILGFGQANSSMISQLASVGKVKKMFAHCLDGTNGGGIFAIGQLAIEVGHDVLQLPTDVLDSQSGKAVVIDSGTTLAYLADDMFTPLMEKIMATQPDLKLHTVEQQFTCFQFNGKATPKKDNPNLGGTEQHRKQQAVAAEQDCTYLNQQSNTSVAEHKIRTDNITAQIT